MSEYQRPKWLSWIPCICWLVQLEICAIVSLGRQTGTVFVHRMTPALDFHDFLDAASLWTTGQNPYSDPRFVTPPFSLLVGIVGLHFPHAAALFLIVNLMCVCLATYLLARTFHLSSLAGLCLIGSALAFYPVYFLLERGNIDGLVLLLFALSLSAKSMWVRVAALAVANNLKLYTLLPSLLKATRRRWREVALLAVATVCIAIPFAHWDTAFLHNLSARSQLVTGTENLSPALIFGSILKHWQARYAYLLAWAVTLMLAMGKLSGLEEKRAAVWLTPWMVAVPLQVYPYSGILFIALLAGWMSERGETASRDILTAVGLCLVGVQQQAFTDAFGWFVHSHRFFPFMNSLGVVLLAIAVMMTRKKASAEDSLSTAAELGWGS